MVVQVKGARERRRFVWAVLFAVLVATHRVMAVDVYIRVPGRAEFIKWCETASNWDYITRGCWRY